MKKLYQILFTFIALCSLTLTYAHSGRTDASGGHYNRKTGEYHYHNSGYSSPSVSVPTYTPPEPEQPTPPKRPSLRTQVKAVSITENHWQVALNNKLFNGKLEVPVSTGRVDIATEQFVVEVDKVSKYAEGIQQALKYAQATGKTPVLALYIDGEKNGYELLQQADTLCKEKGVTLLLANCYVSVNDLISLVLVANSDSSDYGVSAAGDDSNYWLTISSNIRHNSSCRYYMNSNGRKCTKSEGRACKICGG
jgi:preprotein translocase subunit SecG